MNVLTGTKGGYVAHDFKQSIQTINSNMNGWLWSCQWLKAKYINDAFEWTVIFVYFVGENTQTLD